MRIKKGDNVRVMTGKDKGKEGKVARAMPSRGFVIIEGINVFKKHARPKRQGEKGQTVSIPGSLAIGTLGLFCPRCARPRRVGIRREEGRVTRYCKKCGGTV